MASKQTEKVTIQLFKDNEKYKDDVFVAVNGHSYQIKRGVKVEVPQRWRKCWSTRPFRT